MSAEEVKEKVISLVEPLLKGYAMELVDLEYQPGRNGRLLIYIDKPGGVTIGDCEAASREISDLLDLYDPIDHRYVLEVSSPGVERPLKKREHFERFQGEAVKIQLAQPVGGRKNFAGILEKVNGDLVVMRTDEGDKVELPLSGIARARLWYKRPEVGGKKQEKPQKRKR